MIWLGIILVAVIAILGAQIWLYQRSAEDLSSTRNDVKFLIKKADIYSSRIIQARNSLLISWMDRHDPDCSFLQVPSTECDCGTDIYNAVLNDALQHLTLKVQQ